jgi:hypothetical protein
MVRTQLRARHAIAHVLFSDPITIWDAIGETRAAAAALKSPNAQTLHTPYVAAPAAGYQLLEGSIR